MDDTGIRVFGREFSFEGGDFRLHSSPRDFFSFVPVICISFIFAPWPKWELFPFFWVGIERKSDLGLGNESPLARPVLGVEAY